MHTVLQAEGFANIFTKEFATKFCEQTAQDKTTLSVDHVYKMLLSSVHSFYPALGASYCCFDCKFGPKDTNWGLKLLLWQSSSMSVPLPELAELQLHLAWSM